MERLESLMAHLSQVWACDAGRYPQVALLSADELTAFKVRHSLMHLVKSRCRISAVSDRKSEASQILAVKLFLNAVNLARELNFSPSSVSSMLSSSPASSALGSIDLALEQLADVCENFDHTQVFGPDQLCVARNMTCVLLESVSWHGMSTGLSTNGLVAQARQYVH